VVKVKRLRKQAIGVLISFSLLLAVGVALEGSITASPTNVYGGENFVVTVTLHNDLSTTLRDVKVFLDVPATLGSAREVSVGTLQVGADYSTDALFTTLEAMYDTYVISASATYRGGSADLGSTTVVVTPFPLLFELLPEKESAAVDEDNTLLVRIRNQGDRDLTNVVLTITPPYNFAFEEAEEFPIGLLVRNELIERTYHFYGRGGGEYHIGAELSFSDLGEPHTYSKEVTVKIAGTQGFGWLETIITILIILLLLRIVWAKLA
jgi:hypothetical protein